MTNTPGDGQPPQDPFSQPSGERSGQGDEQQGYWQQQQHPGQYGQPGQYGGQPPQQYSAPPPYGQPPGYPPTGYAPDHPKATTSLVLGILGLVLCGVLAPFAWVMGKRAVTEIDASNGQLGGRGAANAGKILGIIGTVLLGLGILFGILLVVLAIAGVSSTSTST